MKPGDPNIDAGELDRRVRIEWPVLNIAGEQTGEWSKLAEVWGKVEPLSGAEQFMADQIAPRLTHRVSIRYRSGVLSEQRVVILRRAGGRQPPDLQVLHIESVIDVQSRGTKMELLCIENPQPLHSAEDDV